MSKVISMDSSEKDKNEKNIVWENVFKVLPLSTIISFLGIFFTIWFLQGYNPYDSVVGYIKTSTWNLKYDTYTVKLDDSVPEQYREQIQDSLSNISYEGINRFSFVDSDADITVNISENEENSIFAERLVPVAHLYSLTDDFDSNSLSSFNVYMIDSLYESYLENILDVDITVLEDEDALVSKLEESDSNIGFVLFDELIPDIKILYVDGEYFLDNIEASLPVYFAASSEDGIDGFVQSILERNLYLDLQLTTFSDDTIAKINMTGVTAISRQLASVIDSKQNYDYPAEKLGAFLSDADLTHTSNEVSFMEGCTVYDGMRFCSNPEYLAALLTSGIDIVELTGNHNNDFGSAYSTSTIETYVENGMDYFGGGLDSEDAAKILYKEVDGTTIAFIGYNYYDTMYGSSALASDDRSGANSYSEEKMASDIAEANENADIVIVDFQFQECYCYPSSDVIYPICYKPLSNPDQKGTFRLAIDDGADIVIGTQAHQPQTFETYNDGVIFYGLGNLYFDQDEWIGTRQGLVLTHYFYEGKHIQTKITPIYMDKDLQPDFATEEEGDLLMELLQEARVW